MLKRSLALAICMLLMMFIMTAHRKTIAKLLILILPFSLATKYGQINIYIIILLCGLYLASDAIKGIKQANLSGSIHVFFTLFLISYGLSFIINFEYLGVDEGAFLSPHVQAFFILISCLFLFTFISGLIDSQEDIYEYLGVMIIAYLLSSVFAFIQIIKPNYMAYLSNFITYQDIADSAERGMRVYGTLGGYELFAEYSGIVFLASFCMMLQSQNMRNKIIWLCAMVISIFLLFMTKSRGPIVGLLVCVAYLIIFHSRVLGVKRISLFLLGSVASFGLIYILTRNSKYNIIDGLLKSNIDVSSGKFDSRTTVWKHNFDYLMSLDFINQIFGVGPGLVSRTALLLYFPHNLYLYLLISLGLFGTVLYIFWFLWIGFSRQGKLMQDKNTRVITGVFKAITIFFIIDQMKIEYTRVANYQQIIWAYFALIYMQVHRISVTKPEILKTNLALAAGCFHASHRPGNSLEKRLQAHDNT